MSCEYPDNLNSVLNAHVIVLLFFYISEETVNAVLYIAQIARQYTFGSFSPYFHVQHTLLGRLQKVIE